MTQTVEVKLHEYPKYRRSETREIGKEKIEIPDEYVPVRKARYGSQRQVTQAFIKGKFPTHNVSESNEKYVGRLYSSDNFQATVRDDGSGLIRHYRTIETVRTKTGLIIVNSQCWSGGFAHCSPPSFSKRDGTLPLTDLINVIDNPIENIVRVKSASDRRHPTVAKYEDGSGVAVLRDGTSKNYGEEVVFKLTKDEMRDLENVSEVDEIIKPASVKRVEDRKDVVRQGEWWFIPRPQVSFSKDRVVKALKQIRNDDGELKKWSREDDHLGNHVPRDKVIMDDGRMFVRGTVRHLQDDHDMINLGETWHKALKQRDKEVHIAEPRGGGRAD